jgi:chromosome segregation ATPase
MSKLYVSFIFALALGLSFAGSHKAFADATSAEVKNESMTDLLVDDETESIAFDDNKEVAEEMKAEKQAVQTDRKAVEQEVIQIKRQNSKLSDKLKLEAKQIQALRAETEAVSRKAKTLHSESLGLQKKDLTLKNQVQSLQAKVAAEKEKIKAEKAAIVKIKADQVAQAKKKAQAAKALKLAQAKKAELLKQKKALKNKKLQAKKNAKKNRSASIQ